MNITVKLVKVQILPTFVTEDEKGQVTGELTGQQPITVYACDVKEIERLLNEILDKAASNVLTPKG